MKTIRYTARLKDSKVTVALFCKHAISSFSCNFYPSFDHTRTPYMIESEDAAFESWLRKCGVTSISKYVNYYFILRDVAKHMFETGLEEDCGEFNFN